MSLYPTEKFSFAWLSGTQEEDLSSRSGELLSGGLGLVAFGSDWQWLSGGFITELLVSSVWVNGLADASLAFNRTVINLDTAGQYIEITPVTAPVPEPGTLSLMVVGMGVIGWVVRRKKRKQAAFA